MCVCVFVCAWGMLAAGVGVGLVGQGIITAFVPPFIIMSPCLYSYMLDPLAHWTVRLSLGGSAIMSLVFFHNAQSKKMPLLDYLTILDKYIYWCPPLSRV
jgi:hypothetical protein